MSAPVPEAGSGNPLFFASPGELGSPLPVPPFGFLHLDPAQIVPVVSFMSS